MSLGPLTLLKHLRHLPLRQRQQRQQQQRVHINIFRTACNFLNFLLNSRRFCLPPYPPLHLAPSFPFLWACNNQLRLRHSGILCAPTFMVIVWQQRKINLFFYYYVFFACCVGQREAWQRAVRGGGGRPQLDKVGQAKK